MCGKYAKTKSEIIKHNKKEHNIFFVILNFRSRDFKPLLEKANPTSIDSLLDNPNPLIRNVSAQPLDPVAKTSVTCHWRPVCCPKHAQQNIGE